MALKACRIWKTNWFIKSTATELSGLDVSIEISVNVSKRDEKHQFEQKRKRIELLIDRVIVTNGDVEICYVIPTSPASEHVRFCHLRKDYFRPHSSRITAQSLLPIRQVSCQTPRLIFSCFPMDQQIDRIDLPGRQVRTS